MRFKKADIACVAAAFLLTGPPAFARDSVVLQLRWDHQYQFAGYYAAKWQGYYDQAGLDVEIRSAFEPGGKFHNVMTEVAEGRADFGTAGADILRSQDRGAPLVIVSSIYQQSPVAFYARAGTNLHSPGDLAGLRVGTRPGGIAGVELRAILRAESIDPARIPLRAIQGNLGVQDIANGLLDVASGFTISAGWYARQLGLKLTALRPQSYGVDFYGDALFTNREWIERNPELVQRFAAASLKGWEYALTHAEAVADRISRELPRKVEISDPKGFNRFQTAPVHRLIQYPIVQLGHTNPSRWQRMHDALMDAGMVKGKFNPDVAIFNLPRLKRVQFERNVTIAASLVAILILAGIVGWIVMLRRGLTRRREVEAELRNSEGLLRAIIDNSPYLVVLRDTESRILKINKTYGEFYGVTEEEAVGHLGEDWLAEEVLQRVIDSDRKIIVSRSTIESETEVTDSDGTPRHMRVVKFPVLIEDGTVVGVGAIAQNITEYKLAQIELEQQKSFLETLVENIPASFTIKDSAGRYLFANKRICEASGKPLGEIVGKTATEAFGIDPDETFVACTKKAIETGEPILGVEKDSELTKDNIVSSNFVPIKGPDGKVERLLTISFDITEHRQRDEQLRQAQKMEAVGQLTGGVAHDFNNLLTVVLGNLQLLSDRLSGDEASLAYVNSALSGARRGAELTHRLLAFSRKQALVPATVDVRKLVDGVLDLMRRTLGETIDIEVVGASDLWHCEADPAQLESAIVNLAINARDAMPDGGKLTITTQNALLDDDYSAAQADVTPGQYVMIAVSDSGTGIPADVIEHVFEPFFTTKEVGKGSGLGLSMVYGFAKQSGGHVTIYSESGIGTTVKIYLPRSKEKSDDALSRESEREPQARGETILVVEDDPDVRTLTVALLSDLGYAVLDARDAPSALEALDRNSRVNMLFTDVVLPGGMNGPQLAEEINRRCPGVSVLFTSGYTDDAIIHQDRLDERVELLSKPFRKSDLARKVRAVLDKANR